MIREDLLEKSEAWSRFDREVAGHRDGPGAPGREPHRRRLRRTRPPPWFAVEYVRGLTLAEYVTEHGPLPAELGAALGIGLAEALAAIHQAGILHRDLKPSNILLGAGRPRR